MLGFFGYAGASAASLRSAYSSASRWVKTGVLAGVLASSPFAAAAQTEKPTGSRIGRPAPAYIPDNARLSDEDRGLRTAYEFGRCLVQQNGSERITNTLTLPSRKFDEATVRRVANSICLGEGSLTLTHDVLRGAIFRARYLGEFGAIPIAAFAEPIDYFDGVNANNNGETAAASLLDFGSCVVRADQVNAHIFIEQLPGTAKFSAALREIVPQLGPCMFDGMEVQFSKTNLVTILSEALYWEARAAAAAKAAAQ